MDTLNIKDCRCIDGDSGVVISLDTATTALAAIRRLMSEGAYANLLADDTSFIIANLKELEKACEA